MGEIAWKIAPHTEGDPAALLLQGLPALGNVISRGARIKGDGTDHYMNLYAVLVGRTSKRRKGTSRRRIRQLFERATLRLTVESTRDFFR